MSAKKKTNAKSNATQKRNRRRLLTLWRVFRYGFDSFIRNSWLSVAATAVMTITLLIVFSAFVTQNVLNDTIGALREKVDMSIYLKTETTAKSGGELVTKIQKLSSVKSASFVSSTQARKQFAEEHSNDAKVLEALKIAADKTPATLRVVLIDINDTSQLQKFVQTDSLVKKHIDPDHKPSFAGERRNTIESIGRAVNFAQKLGLLAGAIFVIISSLIIFNTIRMAIFNRREEIQMMKLIGANQSFIRGPFLVEAVIYGIIAALIATGIGVWVLYAVSGKLISYEISVQSTIDLVTVYIPFVILAMIIVGAIIGIISSLLATRRYLKL